MEETFYDHIARLDAAIKATIKDQVPVTKLSLYMKIWWSKDLTGMKKQKEQLVRKSYRNRSEDVNPIHEEFRQAWNNYSAVLWKAKEERWVRWLETLDKEGIWAVNRLTSGLATNGGRSRIPTLMVKDPITKQVVKEAKTNEEKGKLLYQEFFLKRTAPLTNNMDYTYVQEK